MTRAALTVMLCFGVMSASAEQPPSPQQLLDAAHKATDLSAAGAYVLQATIAIIKQGSQDNVPPGKLTIVRAQDRARLTLEWDGRTEERVVLGNKQFVVPGQGTLIALGLTKLEYHWDPGRPPQFATKKTFSFGRVHNEKVQGHNAWCFDRKTTAKTKLCFDSTNSLLLYDGSLENRLEEYSDYALFGTSLYPQKIQIHRNNLDPLELQHISILPTQVNDEVFKIPDGAVEIESCDFEEFPKGRHTPEPQFSDAARSVHAQGLLYLYLLINAEGNVTGVQPLATDRYGLAENAVNTVKGWRFKPATCNGHPVAAEMNVEVEFSYR